ncbi:geranylgeranyl reductase family protein [Leptothermofonsia sp. ETS-13]|uniref:geranylgeranyl reductase family protein n=1 Tax=Leptothermofonsia sp. ETS-13 TaxID=3035696 RepID=UPI003B9FBBB4
MKSYDLIVCGAGPAGATAAAIAARAGLRVALIEKFPLPRHKTCGGGMPMVMKDFLYDLAPDAFVESDVLYFRHTWNFGDSYLAPINLPDKDRKLSIWMVQRPIFDDALARQATRSGAELLDGAAVRSLTIEGNRVRVRGQMVGNRGASSQGSDFNVVADYVIGADGANGVTAKAAGLRQRRAIALGMEVEFPYQWSNQHPVLQSEIAHLEYGAVKRGYAWIFPKAEHLNVGAGVFHPGGGDARNARSVRERLRQAIFNYLNSFQLPYDPEKLKFHAHPLPVWNGKEQVHSTDGRILLAGDAAGLINPFFGDGILHAVKSGAIAASCIAEGNSQAYSDRIHAEFAANFDAARLLAQIFYRFPHVCYQYGVKHPKATHAAAQLLAGNFTFSNIAGRGLRSVCRSMISRLIPVRG